MPRKFKPERMAQTHEAQRHPGPSIVSVSVSGRISERYITFDDESSNQGPQSVAKIKSNNVDPHLGPSLMQVEYILDINVKGTPMHEPREQQTLTIAAPNASVEEPANAPTTRLASKLGKLFDAPDHIWEQNNMSDAITNTGLLPKYSAVGTQKKFFKPCISCGTKVSSSVEEEHLRRALLLRLAR